MPRKTNAMALGIHPRVVSEMLGHKSVQITLDTYSHASEAMQRTALDAVEQGLTGS